MGARRAIYEGTLTVTRKSTYAKECLKFLGGGQEVGEVHLGVIFQVADNGGAERVAYELEKKPFTVYFRDMDAVGWYYPRQNRLEYYERNQWLAPNALGFLIPPKTSLLFAQSNIKPIPNGDPCDAANSLCKTLVVPYYSYSARANAQYDSNEGTVKIIMMKQPQALWKLGKPQSGFPESVHFEEYAVDVKQLWHTPVAPPTIVAQADYHLVRVEHSDKQFEPRLEIPETTKVTVEKNHVSTSSDLSPKQRGQWQEYARNEAVWKEIDREQDVSWAPIGAGILLVFGGALLIRYWLSSRKKAK